MGLFDNAVPGGAIAKPVMVALGTLLVGKLLSGGGATAAPQQGTAAQSPGGASSGGGLMGGLSGLLDRLSNAGHGETAQSWVGTGQNLPIQSGQLGSALGQTTVSELARNAGMSEQQLLAELSRVLPGVVDKLTPDGRVPSQAEIASRFSQA
jgi:uncharacterized protein YidB (DUF937 family)